MQGNALFNNLAISLYQFASSIVPQGGGIQSALGLAPGVGDSIFQWTNSVQKWGTLHTHTSATNWTGGGEPVLNVSEAVMYKPFSGAKWVRNFSVQ